MLEHPGRSSNSLKNSQQISFTCILVCYCTHSARWKNTTLSISWNPNAAQTMTKSPPYCSFKNVSVFCADSDNNEKNWTDHSNWITFTGKNYSFMFQLPGNAILVILLMHFSHTWLGISFSLYIIILELLTTL